MKVWIPLCSCQTFRQTLNSKLDEPLLTWCLPKTSEICLPKLIKLDYERCATNSFLPRTKNELLLISCFSWIVAGNVIANEFHNSPEPASAAVLFHRCCHRLPIFLVNTHPSSFALWFSYYPMFCWRVRKFNVFFACSCLLWMLLPLLFLWMNLHKLCHAFQW